MRLEDNKSYLVNGASNMGMTPQHSVFELGRVIPKILWTLATAVDKDVPFLMSIKDLKDGYWRIDITIEDVLNFVQVLTLPSNIVVPLGIPNAFQMGWVNLPAFFFKTTKIVRDITKKSFTIEPTSKPQPYEVRILLPIVNKLID